MIQEILGFTTRGRGFVNITHTINEKISKSTFKIGLCNLFLHHTSASLLICENADPLVLSDLEAFMQRLTPDGDPLYQHTAEGPDDMPAHVRTILTQTSITIPITDHALALGTWQGVFLWEHRLQSLTRKLTLTFF